MVLGEMKGPEAGLVGEPDQLEPVPEELVRRRARNSLDVVEDAEGRGCQGGVLSVGVCESDVTRSQTSAEVFHGKGDDRL
ncbi:MAG: hypothetical protein ACM3QU_09995 [Verrucomicrobiota bacterium]